MSLSGGEICAVVFYGLSDADKGVKDVMRDIWEETFGPLGGARTHSHEMVNLLCDGLTSSFWGKRSQSATSISYFGQKYPDEVIKYAVTFIRTLLKQLMGRTWDGKVTLLTALNTCCDVLWDKSDEKSMDQSLAVEVVTFLAKETKNRKGDYRRKVVAHLSSICKVLSAKIPVFPLVSDVLLQIVEKDGVSDDDDEEGSKPRALSISAEAWKALGNCWPRFLNSVTPECFSECTRYWNLILSKYGKSIWIIQQSMLESMRIIFSLCEKKMDPNIMRDDRDSSSQIYPGVTATQLAEVFIVVLDPSAIDRYEVIAKLTSPLLRDILPYLLSHAEDSVTNRVISHIKSVSSRSDSFGPKTNDVLGHLIKLMK